MLDCAIILGALLLLVTMSVRADRRLGGLARLPMQWSLKGSVNWTAPRKWALAFTPLLAAFCLSVIFALARFPTSAPRPGEGTSLTLLSIGLAFVAIHALHIRLVERAGR